MRKALGEKFERAVPEISVYLVESVGNSTRIDYGTGKLRLNQSNLLLQKMFNIIVVHPVVYIYTFHIYKL